MFDFTTPYDKNIASKIGFIQAPNESQEQFEARIHYCMHHKEEQADSYLFGWIPVFYINKGLSFFEAGATIIEEKSGIPCPKIFLRKAFKTKQKWLLYSKEEVLRHELVHVYRCAFNEPIFEEFIAYSTSKNKFRRYIGPIFQHQYEVIFFMVASILPIFYFNIVSCGILCSALIGFLSRLYLRQRKFIKKTKRKLPYQQIISLRDDQF